MRQEKKSSKQKFNTLKIELIRKTVQLLCFILFNASFLGISPIPVIVPVLQSLGSIHNTVGEAIGLFEWMIYNLIFPWLPIASILIFAILSGRSACGWICPFGFLQDLLAYARVKKKQIPPKTHQELTSIKYLILIAFLTVSVGLAIATLQGIGAVYRSTLGVVGLAPFTVFSPSDSLFALTPRLILIVEYTIFPVSEAYGAPLYTLLESPLLWIRLTIMIGVLLAAIYIPRVWCRYLCPQGAMLALASRFSFLGLRRDPVRCLRATCRACVEACPMNIRILDLPWEKFTDPECIFCLRCVMACPTKAIKPKFP